jgi:predicted glycogen debranching enzyme
MEWHLRGTRYNIHVDAEGLLCAGSPEHQLTWMDAKVGDWVVTPRHGRAVEINALWYNAQAMVGELDAASGDDQSACQYRQGASRTRRAFRSVFWDPQLGYLRDVVHAHYTSSALRPNQLLALSLPFALLGRGEARSVLDIVERELLTPFGIRTLSASDPDYRGVCAGDPLARDGAYHQGTVWPWLLGPYFDAVEKVRGTDALRVAVGPVFRAVEGHLAQAGVGSVSEIFDGDPPHTPRGCIAQAWSVAELLRVALRLQQRTTPRPAL